MGVPQPGGSTLWLDPTATWLASDVLPWQSAGATIRPRPDGKADFEVDSEFTGEQAAALRAELAPAAENARLSWLQDRVSDRLAGGTLRSHAIHELEDLDKPLRLSLWIEAPGLVTGADDLVLVRVCALTCTGTNPLGKGTRRHPFVIDPGWNYEETLTVVPPEGMVAGALPGPVPATTG
ncbi:MAG: hypothetical protein ACRD5D_01955 [Candidatus Polarisedimenticolia bacterium]